MLLDVSVRNSVIPSVLKPLAHDFITFLPDSFSVLAGTDLAKVAAFANILSVPNFSKTYSAANAVPILPSA